MATKTATPGVTGQPATAAVVKKRKIAVKSIVFIIVGLLLIGVISFLLYNFRNDLFLLVPGYYQSKEYNDYLLLKSDLVESNSLLLSQNDELETQAAGQENTVAGFDAKIAFYEQIVSNFQTVQENLVSIVAYDEQFLGMRLPFVVQEYVRLLSELDNLRSQMVDVSLDVASARLDLARFGRDNAEFEACINGIDWELSATDISAAITTCVGHVQDMKAQTLVMQETYGVTLDQTIAYLDALSAQWTASSAYYAALAEHNNQEAAAQDAIYADMKRQIEGMDVVAVFNEFYVEKIGPLVDEFVELSAQEPEKESAADEWYRANMER